MKKYLLILSALLLAGIGAKAQTFTGGDYLISTNVDGKTLYLGGGLAWGTQATLFAKPQFFTFEGQSGGTYKLNSHQYGNDNHSYMGLDGESFYVDNQVQSSAATWTVGTVDGGYVLSTNGSYLVVSGSQVGSTATTNSSEATVWTLISKDDVISTMDSATKEAPVDVTALISFPDFKNFCNSGGDSRVSGDYVPWTVTEGTIGYVNAWYTSAACMEAYDVAFNASQTITLPLAGTYKLSAQGFYRDGSTTANIPYLYAGDATSSLPQKTTDISGYNTADGSGGTNQTYETMADAYQAFLNGEYPVDAITITVAEANTDVTIGFAGTGTDKWVCFGELELLYYGEVELETGDVVHECTAELSHWTTTGNNGTHEQNTWSEETDDSGMKTPFCQNWVWSGDADYNENITLTTATISHETLTNLEPGHYTVSMDIRIFSEKGNTIGTGTTFNANGVSEDIATGGDATSGSYTPSGGTTAETEVYGTYTLDCIVYDDGTLDISIVIPDGVTYNWIAWKNLSVTYSGPIEEPAIGYATADKTVVQPGEEVTITFKKVTPEGSSYTLSGSTFTDNTTGTDISVTYSDNGVFTFTVPETTEANSTFTITIPAGQLYYSETVKSAVQTLTFTVPYMLDESLTSGMFMKNLYNNDLLSRGKDVGTRADVDFVGIPVTLTMNDEGKYTIWYADADQSRADAEHQSYLYGPNWVYADGSASQAATFSVEEVKDANGTLLGYHFVSDLGYLYRYDADKASATDYDDNYALALNGVKGENYSDDNQAIWTFVGIEERNAIKAQWVADQKVAVAEKAGITVTSGDDFDKYVASLTETAIVENEISTAGETNWEGGTYTDYGVESYQTYTRLKRSFDNLTPGIYKITLNGFDRNSDNAYSWEMYEKGYTDLSESYIYANGYEINLQAWGSEATRTGSEGNYSYTPNGMDKASEMFEAGSYLNTLYTYVGEDQKLDIQIALLVTEYFGWAQVKNFSLYQLEQTETEISWEMTEAGYGTLILPFAADLSSDEAYSGLTAYTIGSVTPDTDDEDIAATLTLTDAGSTIEANTPYIMGGTADTYTFTGTPTNTQNSYSSTPVTGVSLTGTLVNMSLEDGDFTTTGNQYVLQNHDEGGLAFYPITTDSEATGVTLDAYHCYLTYSNAGGVRGFISFPSTDDATAIKAIEGAEAEANGAIYDLSGRKVSKAVKGVYIQNGKKVLVK